MNNSNGRWLGGIVVACRNVFAGAPIFKAKSKKSSEAICGGSWRG
ncbi:MAG: hypothetical protein WDN00_16745 [Limisphaerales bacterium]